MPCDVLEQPQQSSQPAGQAKQILIVDEDVATADSLAPGLSRRGFRPLTAHCGRVGLELARSANPAVILLDLRLPDTDGLTLCQRLFDSPETCGIPVIVVSRLDQPHIVRRCRAAGCHFYVRKPYDPNVLLVLIQQAIADTHQWREVG